jgi:hypothetical protein
MINRSPMNSSSPPQIGATITAHYYREGWANILPDTTSKVKAPAIFIEFI